MNLLQMSFSGAFIIIAIMIIRALFINKLPKNTFLILWVIALVRLLIPYTIPSTFSIYSVMQENKSNSVILLEEAENINEVTTPMNMEIVEDTVLEENNEVSFPIWLVIWVVGVCFCSTYFVVTYVRCYRKFRISMPIDDDFIKEWKVEHKIKRNISFKRSSEISTPISYGIVHPTILIPSSFPLNDLETLKYVLEHEYVHIQRFDIITKRITILAVCIHWFNPFVWIMYVLFNRDIEISCDNLTVWHLGINMKATYARTLISLEETKSNPVAFYNAFSRNSIEERIVAIMKIKKVTVAAIFFSVLLVICVITVFATSAVSDKEVSETYLVEDAGPIAIIPEEENLQDLMQEYEKFGITRENGVLYYHDEIIRYFLDGYEHESGNTISRYSEYNGAGTIDVHTVRNDIQNADGSTTLFGEIVDIVPYSQEEFDKRDLETLKQQKMVTEAAYVGASDSNKIVTSEATAIEEGNADGESIAERLAMFQEFGITYEEINGNQGDVYWNDELLKEFIDMKPNGDIFLV